MVERNETSVDTLPVVVIGAGPVGLAAAAHLSRRDLPFVVLEEGASAGAAVSEWGHVRLFSPWRYNTDTEARRLLEESGWRLPDSDHLPTGAELVENYLRPLANHPVIEPHIRYGSRVVALSREGFDRVKTAGRQAVPFVVRLSGGDELRARAVIDASGTWEYPNVLGANGLPAVGETALAEFVEPALPDVLGVDLDRFAGKHILVVGAGHSAANTMLALAELVKMEPGTKVTWAVRGASPDGAFGGGDGDALPGRGALGTGLRNLVDSGSIELLTGFGVRALELTDDKRVEVTAGGPDGKQTVVVDRIIAATGFRPDHSIADELRLELDPVLGCTRELAPLIDPNLHSCGSVRPHGVDELSHPEPNYFAVGMKSYGRAPTFLMATGYEQVRSISAALAGDWEAARDVQLELPETGVCSATTGARAIATDVATRLGLPADIPAKLISGTVGHISSTPDLRSAVHAAATDLGIRQEATTQLAELVSDELEAMMAGDDGAATAEC
ncbi:FAD-dependent oxidoreductase [Parasphingorhabdus pacifica]